MGEDTSEFNDQGVNDYFQPEEVRVPFRNMVYIGDSDTDVPCMKLVNSYGGHSIGVFNLETQDKTKVHKMMRDNRIRYYAPADYCALNALAIDEPLGYARLVLDGEMQMWVDAEDSLELW